MVIDANNITHLFLFWNTFLIFSQQVHTLEKHIKINLFALLLLMLLFLSFKITGHWLQWGSQGLCLQELES